MQRFPLGLLGLGCLFVAGCSTAPETPVSASPARSSPAAPADAFSPPAASADWRVVAQPNLATIIREAPYIRPDDLGPAVRGVVPPPPEA